MPFVAISCAQCSATHAPIVAISVSFESSSSAGYFPAAWKRKRLSWTKAIVGFLTSQNRPLIGKGSKRSKVQGEASTLRLTLRLCLHWTWRTHKYCVILMLTRVDPLSLSADTWHSFQQPMNTREEQPETRQASNNKLTWAHGSSRLAMLSANSGDQRNKPSFPRSK